MMWDVLQGDCLEVVRGMDAESIDAIVTDPPYGLSFMGKGWDHGIPGLDYWRAALRVAKPGAHLVAFGGTRTFHRLTCAIEDAGWEIRDCLMWLYGQGFPKSKNLDGAWPGWGTALKPAWEPIVLARKPLIGTVAANVQAHGTGAINIDGCRVAFVSAADKDAAAPALLPRGNKSIGTFETRDRTGEDPRGHQHEGGRWPANLILAEEAGALLDAQSGVLKSGVAVQRNGGGRVIGGTDKRTGSRSKGDACADVGYGDTGGASRFFYCAKASKADRGEGNSHPTVKPQSLMRWLCRLVTPPGGLVLDPFAGSGTTLLAARAEGMQAIGIELDPSYVEIARMRMKAIK